MDDRSPAEFVALWAEQLRSLECSLDDTNKSPSEFVTLSQAGQRLQGELNEWAARLPSYELRRSEQDLKALLLRLSSAQAAAAPKPKFAFKRQPKQSTPTTNTPTPSGSTLRSVPSPSALSANPIRSPAPPAPTPPAVPPTALKLAALPPGYISRAALHGPGAAESASLLIADLRGSVVDLVATDGQAGAAGEDGVAVAAAGAEWSAVYLYDLTECVVLLPLMKGSVMIHNCKKCIVLLGVHQFRMHDSSDCTVLLHTASQPIIERSSALVFGPYPTSLTPSPLSTCGPLAVQDFDHPFASAEHPSPSWRAALPEEAEAGVADARWATHEARREHWQELVEALL